MDNENKIKASVSEAEESKAAETADNASENAAVKPAENEAVKTAENEASAETVAAENKSGADENEEPVKEEPPKNRRNTKWFIGAFIAMFLVFIMPLVTIGVVTFALPPVYDNTFIGELGEKYDRLKSIDEPKIVIIGGSSVAFGIDSRIWCTSSGRSWRRFCGPIPILRCGSPGPRGIPSWAPPTPPVWRRG